MFENHWLSHDDFIQVAVNGWAAPDYVTVSAKRLTAKFKNRRKELRTWKKQLPKLQIAIEKIKLVMNFLETVELYIDLSLPEWNFRNIISES